MTCRWETFLSVGKAAWGRGDLEQAVEAFAAAVDAAESFGPGDGRLALGLNNLAACLEASGSRSREAGELEQKARRLAAVEGALRGFREAQSGP